MTLMACYGMPPCEPHTTADGGTSTTCVVEPPADAGTGDGGTTCADGGAPVDGGC